MTKRTKTSHNKSRLVCKRHTDPPRMRDEVENNIKGNCTTPVSWQKGIVPHVTNLCSRFNTWVYISL